MKLTIVGVNEFYFLRGVPFRSYFPFVLPKRWLNCDLMPQMGFFKVHIVFLDGFLIPRRWLPDFIGTISGQNL
jgi:hypothetical protein